jgi:hypothetical protein
MCDEKMKINVPKVGEDKAEKIISISTRDPPIQARQGYNILRRRTCIVILPFA